MKKWAVYLTFVRALSLSSVVLDASARSLFVGENSRHGDWKIYPLGN
jgi:hypothetical protein